MEGPMRFSSSMPRYSSPHYQGGGGGPRNAGMYGPRSRFSGPHFRHGQSDGDGTMGHFDGKRLRGKAGLRKTVDYNCSLLNYIENRLWQRDMQDAPAIQPDELYSLQMLPPPSLLSTPMNCVTSRFVRTSTNKIKCPIFCVCWTPEGRRLITGASSGEFTLWNGLTFNFETILQAHDVAVRAMVWSHSDQWMLTADHAGFVKYWQSNMNNVQMYQAHKDPVRGLSFGPTDYKYASCSDDGTVRVWDFLRCHEERILRGHGADVKCVDWHPQKSLIASGSKDAQQPLKLWDPRTGTGLATIHAHKNTVMEVKWNRNGNWLLTASRDHLLKLFDVRNMKEEMQSFKGHKKEATAVAWHPIHEGLFASGGSEGSLMFWMVGNEKEVGSMDEAHDMMVWSLAWHPLGHILVSGSNDHTTKFWTRNRPGDTMKDKYNLNLLPPGMFEDVRDESDTRTLPSLPGIEASNTTDADLLAAEASIPGLDLSGQLRSQASGSAADHRSNRKKIPFSKPVPRDFEMAWTKGTQSEGVPRQQTEGPPPGAGSNQQDGDQAQGPQNFGGPHGQPMKTEQVGDGGGYGDVDLRQMGNNNREPWQQNGTGFSGGRGHPGHGPGPGGRGMDGGPRGRGGLLPHPGRNQQPPMSQQQKPPSLLDMPIHNPNARKRDWTEGPGAHPGDANHWGGNPEPNMGEDFNKRGGGMGGRGQRGGMTRGGPVRGGMGNMRGRPPRGGGGEHWRGGHS